MADALPETEDRDEVYRAFHGRMQERYLRTLVSREVIEEHRATLEVDDDGIKGDVE